jgi:hypothetical protein
MNFVNILKKRFMDDWTGGASGEPNRYHGRGAFEDFNLGDMLRQNRWITEESGRNPRSERPEYTSYYHPRLTGESMRSFMEDQRSDPRAFPMGNGPMVTDPGLNEGFQDWPIDHPAHRYHPGASGVYNPAAGQAALADRRPPGLSFDNTTRTIVQDKDGIKETVVTKTPNPETSMMEIMKRLRELQEMRAK